MLCVNFFLISFELSSFFKLNDYWQRSQNPLPLTMSDCLWEMLICESQTSHSLNYSWPHSLLMTSSSHLQLYYLLLTFSIHFQLSQSHFWLFNLLSLFKNCDENLQKNPRPWLVLTDLQWWVFEAWRLSFSALIIEND